MREPRINDSVRLTQDIPDLCLGKGEMGIVRSTWFAPSISYEVEFHPTGQDDTMRCLVGAEQLEVKEDSSLPDETPAAALEMASVHVF
jgi:hypothetical protein